MGTTLKLGGDMIEKLRMETKEMRRAIEKFIENSKLETKETIENSKLEAKEMRQEIEKSRLEMRDVFAKMDTDRTYSVHERISRLEERSKSKSFGASAS